MKNLLGLLTFITLTSCMSFSDRPLRPIRDAITAQLPEIHLEKEFAISIGSGVFNFLDIITLNEADLSELDTVHVAIYEVSSTGRGFDFPKLDLEQTLLAKDPNLHWDTVVRVRKPDERVWVLAGIDLDRNSLAAIAVVVLNASELVLIHVDGDLSELLEYAMAPARGHTGVLKSG